MLIAPLNLLIFLSSFLLFEFPLQNRVSSYIISICIFMLSALLNLLIPCFFFFQRQRGTRFCISTHHCSIQIPCSRSNQYFHLFIPSADPLFNSLPSCGLPSAYDLSSEKRVVKISPSDTYLSLPSFCCCCCCYCCRSSV